MLDIVVAGADSSYRASLAALLLTEIASLVHCVETPANLERLDGFADDEAPVVVAILGHDEVGALKRYAARAKPGKLIAVAFEPTARLRDEALKQGVALFDILETPSDLLAHVAGVVGTRRPVRAGS